jgi:hypothetical protein
VPFGDWPGFVDAIQRAFFAFAHQPRETDLRIQRQALAIRTLYSFDQERHSIDSAWSRIEDLFNRRQ